MKNEKKIKKPTPNAKVTDNKISNKADWKKYGIFFLILIITFIAYFPSLSGNFLNWDDNSYILNNPHITSINLKKIFSEFYIGNYHPLTLLVYSLEYKLFGFNPTGYHLVNLFLHLLNVLLVYFFIVLLSNEKNIAFFVSFIFAIHPMHVESVAWIAELKDVLYAFFFLLALVMYLLFKREGQIKFYYASLLFFVLSLLSKAMAVSLPLVLIITEFYFQKKDKTLNSPLLLIQWKRIMPFLILAFTFGILAINAQKSAGAADVIPFNFIQKLVFASYGFITYIIKTIIPFKLSAFYSYPAFSGSYIPAYLYIYPVLIIILLGLVLYSLPFTKSIFFGLMFYTLTVVFVLQLLAVGGAIMADRYTYIPLIGIVYIIGKYLRDISNRKIFNFRLKGIVIILIIVYGLLMSFKTYQRSALWKNSLTFWNDVLAKEPDVPIAYLNRGIALMGIEKYNEALNDFDKAIALQPNFSEAFYHRSLINMYIQKFDKAIFDFEKAVQLNPELSKRETHYTDAYYGLGVNYLNENKFDSAQIYLSKAINLRSDYVEAYVNRGNTFRNIKAFEKALVDYQKALEIRPDFPITYLNRGILFLNNKEYKVAISDFSTAISLNPQYEKAFYNRGVAFYFLKDFKNACADWEKASLLGYEMASLQLEKFCKKSN